MTGARGTVLPTAAIRRDRGIMSGENAVTHLRAKYFQSFRIAPQNE